MTRRRLRGRVAAAAVTVAVAAGAGAPSLAAAPVTPLPAIAAKKATCPEVLYRVSGRYPVTAIVAALRGQHPRAAVLTCTRARAIARAGRRYFLRPPFRTGEKIVVAGATYTAGVGGPEILPAASGPVYGWFGNGIEVLLIIPSGT